MSKRRIGPREVQGYLAAKDDIEEFGYGVVYSIAATITEACPLDNFVTGYLLGASGVQVTLW